MVGDLLEGMNEIRRAIKREPCEADKGWIGCKACDLFLSQLSRYQSPLIDHARPFLSGVVGASLVLLESL